jgi:SAM-dependent methyltransferase
MYPWEKFFDTSIRDIASLDIIVDIGSGTPFQKEMAPYRSLFDREECRYYTLDFAMQYGPSILGDAQQLPFKSGSVDAVICKAVLEHVPEPAQVVREMYRMLKPGGKLYAYLPFLYPYHGGSVYLDYFRFTKDGVDYLFRDFTTVEKVPVRGHFGTFKLVFLPFLSKNSRVGAWLDKLIGNKFPRTTSGWNVFAVK